jgi:arylsulfatase A-like enzyme/Flp pilus assembly protein TadD
MTRGAVRMRLGQVGGVTALLFVVLLLAVLGWRLTPPEGPAHRSRLRLPRHHNPAEANLVLITLDGLRVDRVGVYGAPLPSPTANLDRLSREAYRFEQAITSSPCSLPAHAALLTGQPATLPGVSPLAALLPADRPTMATILKAAGFRTAAFVGSGAVGRWTGLAQGFDTFDEPEGAMPDPIRALEGRPARAVVDAARRWIDDNYRRRFFVWLQIADVGDPRHAPAEFERRFRDPYDARVASTDAEVGRFLDRLASLGVLGDTVVAVVAAHGAGLGDHGEQGSGAYLYDSTVQVPWLLRVPESEARDRSIPEQVRLLDLLPTLLELLGVESPPLAGVSLVPLLDPGGSLPPLPALSATNEIETFLGGPPLRALRREGWKLIEGGGDAIYDLRRDPGELHDLSASLPQRVAELRTALPSGGSEPQAGPSASRLPDPSQIELLESALLALRAGDGGRAERSLRRLDALTGVSAVYGPDGPPALLSLLGAALRLQGRPEEAAPIYAKAIAALVRATQNGATADGGLEGLLRSDRGACLRLIGDRDGALQDYRQAITLLPEDARSRDALADLYLEAGKTDDAITEYRAALARAPGDATILAGLGRAYLATDDVAAARSLLQEALRSGPAPPRAYFDLGRACEGMQRGREAADAYREYLQRAPPDAADRAAAAERLRRLEPGTDR